MADDADYQEVAIKKGQRRSSAGCAPLAVKTPRKLLISGSKGGIGKTGCSRIVGVAASLEGLRLALFDTDDQRSRPAWHTLRDEFGVLRLGKLDCFSPDSTAPDKIEKLTGYDLVIIELRMPLKYTGRR